MINVSVTISAIFSQKNERSAIIYDSQIINQLELVGEIAVPSKDHKYIKLDGVTQEFSGFDRNPYLCSFRWKNTVFILITVHSFSGNEVKHDLERGELEALAIGRCAGLDLLQDL